MCICRQPDARSDYALLKIPTTLQEYPGRNNVHNDFDLVGSRDNSSIEPNRTELSSNSFDGNVDKSSIGKIVSRWELILRSAMIVFLMFTSYNLYLQQQEVAIQRTKVLESLARSGERRKRLRELRSKNQYGDILRIKDVSVDEYANVEFDYKTAIQRS